MKWIKRNSACIILGTMLLSCGGTTHHLISGNFSKNDSYQVTHYTGCCGCAANYFLFTENKTKTEQIIYSYNCPGHGLPTKFVLNYSASGRLIDCDKYIATVNNDFTMHLNDREKKLFTMLDTNTLLKPTGSFSYSTIKGFRKSMEQEITHAFPLIKKGYKLTVK